VSIHIHHRHTRIPHTLVASDIYVRTRHAWYILEDPSEKYRAEYSRFWRSVRIAQVSLAYAQEHIDEGFEEFTHYLENQFSRESRLIIGRAITRDDFDFAVGL
jgi:DNA (cytosine-5)-methyltransferase 1